jgi:hypothetical protein
MANAGVWNPAFGSRGFYRIQTATNTLGIPIVVRVPNDMDKTPVPSLTG